MLKKIVAGMVVAVLIGCGGPPKAEIEKATMAKKKADDAMAMTYASASYDAANAAMTEGAELVKKNENDKAKAKYVEAAAGFEKAAGEAPAGKDAMKASAEKTIADFEAAWTAGEKNMMTAASKMKGDDKTNFEKMMNDCKAGLAEAKDMMTKEDYKGATDKMATVMDSHKAMMEKMAPKKM